MHDVYTLFHEHRCHAQNASGKQPCAQWTRGLKALALSLGYAARAVASTRVHVGAVQSQLAAPVREENLAALAASCAIRMYDY